jgi:hypothetical protein
MKRTLKKHQYLLSHDDGDEVDHPRFPSACEDEKVINDTNDFMDDTSDVVDQHIDDFIHIVRCR